MELSGGGGFQHGRAARVGECFCLQAGWQEFAGELLACVRELLVEQRLRRRHRRPRPRQLHLAPLDFDINHAPRFGSQAVEVGPLRPQNGSHGVARRACNPAALSHASAQEEELGIVKVLNEKINNFSATRQSFSSRLG